MTVMALLVITLMLLCLAYAFIKKIMISQAIIIANFIIFVLTLFSPSIIKELAFKPTYLNELSKFYTIFTSMFLHSVENIGHILMNMIFLFLIGVSFEHEIGKKKFILIYILSGVVAVIVYSLIEAKDTYLIGASGAIFGILGAFAAAYPFKKVVVPLIAPIIFFVRLPVVAVALLYAGVETFFTFAGITDGTAHSAHIGGFIAGVFLSPLVKIKVEEKVTNLDDFEPFIVNDRQRDIFEKAKQADELELKEAWLAYLSRYLECPKCGGGVEIKKGIKCKKCGYNKK